MSVKRTHAHTETSKLLLFEKSCLKGVEGVRLPRKMIADGLQGGLAGYLGNLGELMTVMPVSRGLVRVVLSPSVRYLRVRERR